MLERYKKINTDNSLIQFRFQNRELQFVPFGITIYNPSLEETGVKSIECNVVFFPHFNSIDKNSARIFLCLKGNQTIQLQEDFMSLWDLSEVT